MELLNYLVKKMLRFTIFLIIFAVFVSSGQLAAQILLDPSVISGQNMPRRPSGTPSPGIVVGGSNPFSAGSNPQGGLATSDSGFSLPPLSGPSPSKGFGVDVNSDFSVGESSTFGNPSYGVTTYGGYNSPRNYRGKTREEIVRMKAEEASMKELARDEQDYQRRINIEADRGMRQSITSLFLGGLPNVLPPSEIPTGIADVNDEQMNNPQQGGIVPYSPNRGSASRQPVQTASSMFTKPVSADERTEQELKAKRLELEKMEDPERKARELEALKRREEARKRVIAQRAEAERGANLFVPPIQLKSQMLSEGWNLLFDGKTFFGWRTQKDGHYGGGQFDIVDGEIRSNPAHPGLLYTTNQFGDSTLIFEYQAEEDAEAFLLLRTPPSPKDLHSSCYTVVLNSADRSRPVGTVLGRLRVDSEQLKKQEEAAQIAKRNDSKKNDRWHRVKAQFEAGRLQITIDQNDPIVLFDTKPLGYGYIGFLAAKGDVRFRNILWTPGSSLPLINPITPESIWRYQGDVKMTVTRDVTMQITGGPGVFETRESYNNFVLHLEYNIAYTSARTGVFFRSIPREAQTGYEVSLQNLPKREDRDTTVGVDAGGFRGTKNGRYVRPEDQAWNHLTLVVVDRQFQTWINGIPVSQMSDKRLLEKEDSKTGPFLLPGTIQLLAPQAGTNVQFRNIRIMPISPRFEKPKTFEDITKTTWAELSKARKLREKEDQLDKEMMSGKKEPEKGK